MAAYWSVVTAEPADSFLGNLADIDLIDQSGQKFEHASLSGRIVLFSFIYTNCSSACPVQTRVLAQVQSQLPPDARAQVRFVSISIDPELDSPQQLRLFAQKMQANLDSWSFLTGSVYDIERLTQRLRLFEAGASRPAMHRASLWLVDGEGRLIQRYAGDPPDRRRLVDELTQLSRMNFASARND